MPSMREVMEEAIALEKQTMALYARFSKCFGKSDSRVQEFWFGMARDEAGHVGALNLVFTYLENEDKLDQPSPVSLEDSTIMRLRELLGRCERQSAVGISIEQALGIALELEETEIEDLVGELLKSAGEAGEYERYQRMLVHDLGDLSYMIERYCQSPELLQRCDALVNRHAESLRRMASMH